MTDPAIKEALAYEKYFTQDELLRRKYDIQEKAMLDYNSGMYNAEQRGIKKGIQKGIQKSSFEIAKKMLAKGSSVEFIIEVTGLSKEEINHLKN